MSNRPSQEEARLLPRPRPGLSDSAGETAPEGKTAAPAAAGQAGAAGDADSQEAAAPGRSMDPEAESSDEMANQETYEGEDQEMEGGWFEDVTEGQDP